MNFLRFFLEKILVLVLLINTTGFENKEKITVLEIYLSIVSGFKGSREPQSELTIAINSYLSNTAVSRKLNCGHDPGHSAQFL